MEPDVVEIAPPPSFALGSRTQKPRKDTIPEVIDVEQYKFRNTFDVLNDHNLIDTKNKGKAIKVSSFSHLSPLSSSLDLEAYQYCGDHNKPMEVDDDTMFQDALDFNYIPTDVEIALPWGSTSGSKATANSSGNPSFSVVSASMVQPQMPEIVVVPVPLSNPSISNDASANCSHPIAAEMVSSVQDTPNVGKTKEEFLRDFKRFDIVEDFSDHHYASKGKSLKQHSKNWVKKVQEDWKILEKDLPETIFVRACELRMDLLRAVIIGAEGTPYHDGLFFFDIHLPETYPSVPPKVHYHSGGLRINPNLYNCGKVCLSLLGTWFGNSREKWIPKESTMLQLLVSIQGLILNQKPYFNEPGYTKLKGTRNGESLSIAYSENVYILSLRTMVYSMRKPPKHFEEFVRSHFYVRAQDIMKACNAYKDGAPVGSVVKGGVQGVKETSRAGSNTFRTNVASFMSIVLVELHKLGVKGIQVKPKPPAQINAATPIRKKTTSSSIKEFLANIGSCIFLSSKVNDKDSTNKIS